MSRLLLDTHTFLWLGTDDERLGRRARAAAIDEDNELLLSVASVWELAIKSSLGKLMLKIELKQLIATQCDALHARLLPVEAGHAIAVERLPFHHRDPFDRLLIAQAQVEGLQLLSRDVAFDAYGGVSRLWS